MCDDSFESNANLPIEHKPSGQFDVTEDNLTSQGPRVRLAQPDRSQLFAHGISTPAEKARLQQLVIFAFLCGWTQHTCVASLANQVHYIVA